MKDKIKKAIKETIPYILILLIVILIRLYIVSPVRVDGPSMNNTLSNGDVLLLNKTNQNYERFDIIVFKFGNNKLIKRIIGLPGDTIEIKKGKVYINDKLLDEPYLNEKNIDSMDLKRTKIDKENYFVIGDNRKDSLDSRYFGSINVEYIEGKVNVRLFPFDKFGSVK